MKNKKLSLPKKILFGFVAGILLGLALRLVAGDNAATIASNYVKPFSDIFLNLIKGICVPLVFCSLVMGASSTGDIKSMGRIGGKTMALFIGTTVISGAIALLVANLVQLGANFQIDVGSLKYEVAESESFIKTIINIIPTNPFASLSSGNMLQIIFAALALGLGFNMVGEAADGLRNTFSVLTDIMAKLTGLVMQYCPIAVAAFMISTISTYGTDLLLQYVAVIGTIYAVAIIIIVAVYFPMVAVGCKYDLKRFIRTVTPCFTLAFTTMSSAATLPVTLENCEELGISNKIRSFVAPLGCTIHMDGTALYEAICAVFIANVYAVDLTMGNMIEIVAIATIASVGCAGVPGAGLIMLGTVLSSAGLPVDGIAMVMGINTFLSPIVTALNVFGDAAAALVVAKSENELDVEPTAKS